MCNSGQHMSVIEYLENLMKYVGWVGGWMDEENSRGEVRCVD